MSYPGMEVRCLRLWGGVGRAGDVVARCGIDGDNPACGDSRRWRWSGMCSLFAREGLTDAVDHAACDVAGSSRSDGRFLVDSAFTLCIPPSFPAGLLSSMRLDLTFADAVDPVCDSRNSSSVRERFLSTSFSTIFPEPTSPPAPITTARSLLLPDESAASPKYANTARVARLSFPFPFPREEEIFPSCCASSDGRTEGRLPFPRDDVVPLCCVDSEFETFLRDEVPLIGAVGCVVRTIVCSEIVSTTGGRGGYIGFTCGASGTCSVDSSCVSVPALPPLRVSTRSTCPPFPVDRSTSAALCAAVSRGNAR